VIAAAVAHYMHSLGLVDLREDAGGDCFVQRQLPPDPDEAVSVTAYGANPVEGDWMLGYDEPTVQVHIRGTDDPRTAESRAGAVYAAWQGLAHTTLAADTDDEVRLILATCQQTGPVYLGTDDLGRHEFVVNLALHVRAQTAHRE
jgi:hypothetical protein